MKECCLVISLDMNEVRIIPSLNYYYTLHQYICNEVHSKTDTLFPGNNITVAEPESLTIRSGGSSSNHYVTLPSFKKKEYPV